jgi:predicted transcriptional regulator
VIDTLAEVGFIQVEEEDNSVSLTETGQKLVLEAESKMPTTEGSEFGSGA